MFWSLSAAWVASQMGKDTDPISWAEAKAIFAIVFLASSLLVPFLIALGH